MTREVGSALSPALVERLSQRELPKRLGVGLPFVTLDAGGHSHPMLVSYLELRAYDAGSLGLVIRADSASARNTAERAVVTLSIIEPGTVTYVKIRALDGPLPVVGGEKYGLGFFLLEVVQVLEDRPGGGEAR